jgi:hypothetical protein
MVGFDVTPTTASSSIMRASSPFSSISRESESTHTLTPCSDNSCSLLRATRQRYRVRRDRRMAR